MSKLRLLDLFSGIGGFSLGLERTGGFDTVAFCEIEPFPRRVLAKHWPEVPCYGDIRTLNAATLHRDGIEIDAICGGFPCQDVSTAGVRAGLAGERSGLWGEYLRLIGELRPRVVFVENVTGLLSLGMGTVLGDLAEIGYDAHWDVISAEALGACHKRERVWITAYPLRIGQQGQGRSIKSSNPATAEYREIDRTEHVLGWPTKPAIRRGDDGVSRKLDRSRLKALGNAVVPQIPELLGRAYLESIGEASFCALYAGAGWLA